MYEAFFIIYKNSFSYTFRKGNKEKPASDGYLRNVPYLAKPTLNFGTIMLDFAYVSLYSCHVSFRITKCSKQNLMDV